MENKQNKCQAQSNLIKAFRKTSIILTQKLIQRKESVWQKLRIISIIQSPQYLSMKTELIVKKISKITTFKLRIYFSQFTLGIKQLSIQKVQQNLSNIKMKDKFYEAKVKTLRVLSRQWKQKKSQNQYKNKYLTSKSDQKPISIKQKLGLTIFNTLKQLILNKQLLIFNLIKSTQHKKILKMKLLYLTNYLTHKRKYWLRYSTQKLKQNLLIIRQTKHSEQMNQLDKKISPAQDNQLESIKQKQFKLQTALQNVRNQKSSNQNEIQIEIHNLTANIQQKKNQLDMLDNKKEQLTQQLNIENLFQQQFQFTINDVFYFVYKNFLINLKLWQQAQDKQQQNTDLYRNLAVEWLSSPNIDFHLDLVQHNSKQQLQELISTLQSIVDSYYRLHSSQNGLQLSDILQAHFSNNGLNTSSNSIQQFSIRNKFSYKIMAELLKQNKQILYKMLNTINQKFQTLKGEQLQLQ